MKVYWDPAKNYREYGIVTTNVNGSLVMERKDFLNLFQVSYEYNSVDYYISQTEAANRLIMPKVVIKTAFVAAGGYIGATIKTSESLTGARTIGQVIGGSVTMPSPMSIREGWYKEESFKSRIWNTKQKRWDTYSVGVIEEKNTGYVTRTLSSYPTDLLPWA